MFVDIVMPAFVFERLSPKDEAVVTLPENGGPIQVYEYNICRRYSRKPVGEGDNPFAARNVTG
jgi:hypothetical protein